MILLKSMLEVIINFPHLTGHFKPISLGLFTKLALLVRNSLHTMARRFFPNTRRMLEHPVTESRSRICELQCHVVFRVRVSRLIDQQVQL